MKEVSIYIESSIHGRWNRDGYIGYVLEYYPEDSKYSKTLSGYERVENMNENRSQIEALIRGISRMREKCILSIYTESDYLYSGYSGKEYVAKWIKAGWRTTRGEEVKNRDKWQELTGKLQGNMYRFALKEQNAYVGRIRENLRQLEEGKVTLEMLNQKNGGRNHV